ncbi:hypothetical protein ACFPIJ_38745 [Dactylosporangium cerinum]|uniref:DUF397 domain-containing protein n=1 Tax=Dactylosporangium cerinum TaxID=1434730 RepID=A0ABV9W514_9ACTN
MNAHPVWCVRAACTAYAPNGDELHRSEPVVVKTSDPAVGLYLSKVADPDGSDEHIELVLLELVEDSPGT